MLFFLLTLEDFAGCIGCVSIVALVFAFWAYQEWKKEKRKDIKKSIEGLNDLSGNSTLADSIKTCSDPKFPEAENYQLYLNLALSKSTRGVHGYSGVRNMALAQRLLISAGAIINDKVKKNVSNRTIYVGFTGINRQVDPLLTILDKSNYKRQIIPNDDLPFLYISASLLIKAGADVNAQSDGGITPLMHALQYTFFRTNDFEGMDSWLIKLREEKKTKEYRTEIEQLVNPIALDSCISDQLCSLLIESGAEVNAKDNEGRTPLMYAVSDGVLGEAACSFEACSLLIEAGADVNAKDNEGRTPLMHAAITCQFEACSLLIEAGADVNAKDNEGRTPLMSLWSEGHSWLNRYHYPAMAKDNDLCSLLTEAGAKINVKDNSGMTPLMHAARACCVDSCIHIFISIRDEDNNYDFEKSCKILCACKDKKGRTPYMHWLESEQPYDRKYLDMFDFFNGQPEYNIDAKDSQGMTALMHAASERDTYLCTSLIKQFCDLNTKDNSGMTPLMHAAAKCCSEVCLLILEAVLEFTYTEDVMTSCPEGATRSAADVNTKDDKGYTALHHAVWMAGSFDVEIKLKNGKIWKGEIGQTVAVEYEEEEEATWERKVIEDKLSTRNFTERRLASGLRVNYPSEVHVGNVNICVDLEKIEARLKKGDRIYDWQIDDWRKYLISINTVSEAKEPVYSLLIKAGADVNAKDNEGVTPLMLAAKIRNSDIYHLLLDFGADLKLQDNIGNTAFDYKK